MKLPRDFYTRPTLKVTKDLLGKYIVRNVGGKKLTGKIVEVEAYMGPQDKGAHSYGDRRTKRTETMYLEGGHAYIYLCYGINWMLNLTTSLKEKPEAVLVRAIEPVGSSFLTNGPGKLCKWLKLDKSFDREDLISSQRLWLEDRGEVIKKSQIVSSERIGINYAGSWALKPWRFYIRDSSFVSRK